MTNSEQITIRVFKCLLKIEIHEVTFQARFPCEASIEWKEGHKNAKGISTKKQKVTNNIAVINEALPVQT